jgi:hypothetical protein
VGFGWAREERPGPHLMMMMMADLQGKQRESNLRNPVRH